MSARAACTSPPRRPTSPVRSWRSTAVAASAGDRRLAHFARTVARRAAARRSADARLVEARATARRWCSRVGRMHRAAGRAVRQRTEHVGAQQQIRSRQLQSAAHRTPDRRTAARPDPWRAAPSAARRAAGRTALSIACSSRAPRPRAAACAKPATRLMKSSPVEAHRARLRYHGEKRSAGKLARELARPRASDSPAGSTLLPAAT